MLTFLVIALALVIATILLTKFSTRRTSGMLNKPQPIVQSPVVDSLQTERAADLSSRPSASRQAKPEATAFGKITQSAPAIHTSGNQKIGCYLDVETTGLSNADEIIEFVAETFVFDSDAGTILDPLEFYVGLCEPSVPINPFAAAVHGLTRDELRGKRLDSRKISDLLSNADILIAHNAVFDRRFVLNLFPEVQGKPWHCSMRQIDWDREGCTSRKLTDLLEHFQVDVAGHHRATPDVTGAVELLRLCSSQRVTFFGEMYQSGPLRAPGPRARQFNAPRVFVPPCSPREIERATQALMDMLKRALIDGAISEMEAVEIDRWLKENKRVLYAWPMSAVECRMRSIMEDGWISHEELADLRDCVRQLLSTSSGEMDAPIPVLTMPVPTVRFKGKSFVFSGKFLLGTRISCRDEIEARGGEVRDAVTRDLNYLVVGSRINPQWANGRYGRKIEAVTHNIDNGAQTVIISEEHLFESLR